jgi:hypothetical protein
LSHNYAFIKNNIVVNIAVFDDPSEDLLNNFKLEHNVDSIVLATENTYMGSTYSEGIFTAPYRFNGWLWNNDKKEWEPPTPYPTDGKTYEWSEYFFEWVALEE